MPSYYDIFKYEYEPTYLQVRSQSESAALNNIKVPRNLFHELEMCRQKINGTNPTLFTKPSNFYAPIQDGIQSDSEGDDSLVSSEEGGSSSSAGCDHDDVDDDLGVVRDLELDDDEGISNRRHHHYQAAKDMLSLTTTLVPFQYTLSNLPPVDNIPKTAPAELIPARCFFEQSLAKKSVRFADDCGHILETVRVMTEPSDYPPRISPSVIKRYRKAAAAAASGTPANDDDDEEDDAATRQPRSSWKMGFKQPASEYVKFRESLEQQKVALENVMLKNDIGRMVGTIKVANIAFEKRVFIRFTSDNWKSYLDRPAVYQSSASKAYDTFRFDIELPRNTSKDSRISFCVCFVANGTDEHWDANQGKNFHLTSPDQPMQDTPQDKVHQNFSAIRALDRDDAYRLETDDWSRFASWKNLSTNTPYY
jgi:protein phosphatase 1 regulatory subunit 3A/B/C/D/E